MDIANPNFDPQERFDDFLEHLKHTNTRYKNYPFNVTTALPRNNFDRIDVLIWICNINGNSVVITAKQNEELESVKIAKAIIEIWESCGLVLKISDLPWPTYRWKTFQELYVFDE